MGGFGSGCRKTRKYTVEECWRLNARDITDVFAGSKCSPTVQASTPEGGTLWVHATVRDYSWAPDRKPRVTLAFSPASAPSVVEEVVSLDCTHPWFGGRRWWLSCVCGRRVASLYAAPARASFRCRTCHDLTYRSVQRHDKRVDSYRRRPAEALRVLRTRPNDFRALFLILRAFHLTPDA